MGVAKQKIKRGRVCEFYAVDQYQMQTRERGEGGHKIRKIGGRHINGRSLVKEPLLLHNAAAADRHAGSMRGRGFNFPWPTDATTAIRFGRCIIWFAWAEHAILKLRGRPVSHKLQKIIKRRERVNIVLGWYCYGKTNDASKAKLTITILSPFIKWWSCFPLAYLAKKLPIYDLRG